MVILGLGHWSAEKLSSMCVGAHSLARSAVAAAVTWQQRDLSLCIPLALSRSVVLLLRLFHIPSRFHPIHPSRRDSRESPRERENGESKEEGTDATSKRRNAWKRDVLEREEKKRGRERWGKGREEMEDVHKVPSGGFHDGRVRSNSLLGRLCCYSSHSNDLSKMYSCYRVVIKFDGLPSIASFLIANKFSKTFIDGIFYWRGIL